MRECNEIGKCPVCLHVILEEDELIQKSQEIDYNKFENVGLYECQFCHEPVHISEIQK